MQLQRTIALLAFTAVAAAACGTDPGGVSLPTERPGTTTIDGGTAGDDRVDTDAHPEHVAPFEPPSDPDALMVALVVGEPHGQLELNEISITADGRVFFPVNGPSGFAPPLGSPPQEFVVRQLTETGLEALVGVAVEDGLFTSEVDYGDPGVSDQGTTTVELWSSSRSVEHNAYALSFEAFETGAEQHRVVLRRFVERLLEFRTIEDPELIGEAIDFDPDAWTVVHSRGFPSDDAPSWGLDADIAGPCVDLDSAAFAHGVIAGTYVVDGSDEPHPDVEDVVTKRIIEVTPAFPWTEC